MEEIAALLRFTRWLGDTKTREREMKEKIDLMALLPGMRVFGECAGEAYTATIDAPSEDGEWIAIRYDGTETTDLAHKSEIIRVLAPANEPAE